MNKYEQLADHIMTAFTNENLNSNIIVGSTDTLDWNDIIIESNIIYGVLTAAGGSNTKIKDGKLESEMLSLSLALPNNTSSDYSEALSSCDTALSNLLSNYVVIDNENAILNMNGKSSTMFLNVKGGKQIGVINISLVLTTSTGILSADDVLVKITPNGGTEQELLGVYNYAFKKQKTFDSANQQSQLEQKNFVLGLQISLTLNYYKISSNTLHQTLATSDNTFTVTFSDGEGNLIASKVMYLSSYTQNGIVGGYVNCEAQFIGGV